MQWLNLWKVFLYLVNTDFTTSINSLVVGPFCFSFICVTENVIPTPAIYQLRASYKIPSAKMHHQFLPPQKLHGNLLSEILNWIENYDTFLQRRFTISAAHLFVRFILKKTHTPANYWVADCESEKISIET